MLHLDCKAVFTALYDNTSIYDVFTRAIVLHLDCKVHFYTTLCMSKDGRCNTEVLHLDCRLVFSRKDEF